MVFFECRDRTLNVNFRAVGVNEKNARVIGRLSAYFFRDRLQVHAIAVRDNVAYLERNIGFIECGGDYGAAVGREKPTILKYIIQ